MILDVIITLSVPDDMTGERLNELTRLIHLYNRMMAQDLGIAYHEQQTGSA